MAVARRLPHASSIDNPYPSEAPKGVTSSIASYQGSTFPQYGLSSLTSGGNFLAGLSLREQLGPSPKSDKVKDEDLDDPPESPVFTSFDPVYEISRLLADDDDDLSESVSALSLGSKPGKGKKGKALEDSSLSKTKFKTNKLAPVVKSKSADNWKAIMEDVASRGRVIPEFRPKSPDLPVQSTNPYAVGFSDEEGLGGGGLGYSDNPYSGYSTWGNFGQSYYDGSDTASTVTQYATPRKDSISDQSTASTVARKARPVESPGSKLTFKAFYREFWTLARTDAQAAFNFAVSKLESLPEKLHWRVCMEIADLAKRQNRINKARKWYKLANKLEPFAAQTWLEHAKMEEECGELIRCQKIVRLGLLFCEYNESLLIKAIKHQERVGNINAARAVLARLKNVSVEKVWRTILEGALLEARAGNVTISRRIFKYLMKYVPWYGPVFFEACRFEERQEEYERAVAVAERGLTAVPKYGPLWFIAFRLYQKLHPNDSTQARQIIRRALESISHDVVWKLYFEAAQMEENIGRFEESRRAYAESVKHCPKNLCWKAWLSGSRMELRTQRIDVARLLLNRSLNGVPKKMRSVVLIECARLEEYAGNTEKARAILRRAQEETNEWKVYLESVLLEARANDMEAAIKEAENALKGHAGTGRLWAVLIQLKQIHGQQEQMRVFRKAIKEVPKSGEVWCEGARMRLDPTGSYFNLKAAHKFLNFAIEFTPQYGDSFIEYLRLKMLLQGEAAQEAINRVKQLCTNADPNYGSLWFYCKRNPLDTASEVMARALNLIAQDLLDHRSLYQQAILNNWYRSHSASQFSLPNPVMLFPETLEDTKSNSKAPSLLTKTETGSKKLVATSNAFIPRKESISGKTLTTWAAVATRGSTPASFPTSSGAQKQQPLQGKPGSREVYKPVVPASPKKQSSSTTSSESSVSKNAQVNSLLPEKAAVPPKSKSYKKIQEYRAQSINSLFRLYPRIDRLNSEERHMVLFGADPITA